MIVTIIAFVVILSILVLIHELGHFLVAKKLGIKVEEFGIGFPPRVFGIRRGETLYSINLLPVGGFVKLFGEDAAGGGAVKQTKKEKEMSASMLKRAFFARPIWQRFAVVVAGVVMNFLLAVVIISYLFAAQGVAIPSDKIHVTDVQAGSPAAAANLQVGDTITTINGTRITSTEEFISTVRKSGGKKITLGVEKNGEVSTVSLTPRINTPEGQGPVGVGISNITVKKYPWYQAPFYGTLETLKFSWLIFAGLGQMIAGLVTSGQAPEGVAGPVGVAQLTGQAVSYGVNATLWFAALLSINLAVLNVLPIPALDGGRLFFIVIEFVTRRKINPKYEGYAHAVGLALLLTLMVVITVFDIVRVASGQSLIPN
ncbi:MAG: RIP metalloprotease RseP [Candidatus Levybacteria bacterium]|nr:RIP metalloprotease RseP [Candidatus Levybacteria bacterium]